MLRDYVREKRVTIALVVFTTVIFCGLGCLYHLENLSRLFYAALLADTAWLAAGTVDFVRYVRKRRIISRAVKDPKQAAAILREQSGQRAIQEGKEAGEHSICSLESAYEQLVEQVDRQNVLLENASEERRTEQSDYYVMWAHQIKTPIAAMKLVMNGRTDLSPKEQKANFLLQEELFKIEQYVEMALNFQRLESMASDLVLSEYDLYGVLKKSVKKFSVLFINRSLSLHLEEMQQRVVTDEKWFGFCVEQFLSNSIKYTLKGSVSVYLEKPENTVLVIEDTGIGIRKEDLPRIFERGFTGYNGRMHQKSTGIGLYLTGQVLSRLGIDVRVESREGEGTKILLDLRELLR